MPPFNVTISPTRDEIDSFLRYLKSGRIYEASSLNESLAQMTERYLPRREILEYRLTQATVEIDSINVQLRSQVCEKICCQKTKKSCRCTGCSCALLQERLTNELRNQRYMSKHHSKFCELLRAISKAIEKRTSQGLSS